MPKIAVASVLPAALVVVLATAPVSAADPAPKAPSSPYFALGAAEKIQWRPWGEDAVREAQERGLPILLDLGAIWCHYCQVMSATTWRDDGVAEKVNEYFLPIKVDRDEHPEVDSRFQAILLEIRKLGGWPLIGFLTEEGRMFAGATFLTPADDKEGRPGMMTAAELYGRSFQDQKRGYNNTAEEIANRFVQAAGNHRSGELAGFADAIADGILKSTDVVKGGFGGGAKFPEHIGVRFALERGALGHKELEKAARASLDGMADGGIRDLLGGGFHRASVDRQWRVPRFEKLLSVNAGLLELYAEAYRLTGEERYRRVASETLDYLLRRLADTQDGGFYTAQAADRDGTDNGSLYTWTMEELKAGLGGDELKIAVAYFELKAEPGLIPGVPRANVLAATRTIEQAAAEAGLKPEKAQKSLKAAIETLKKQRAQRPEPPVDRSMYASLNGIAAHALLVAAPVLGREDARAQALRTLDRFLARAWTDKIGFARGLREGAVLGPGLLQDQVNLAAALLDAYEATGDSKYRDAAARAMDVTIRRFEDRAVYRLADLPVVGAPTFSALVIPDYPVQDTLVPGENALGVLTLARLERLSGAGARLDTARKIAQGFAGSARGYGPNGATLGIAADRMLAPPPRVVIIASEEEARPFLQAALASVRRPAILRFGTKQEVPEWLGRGDLGIQLEKGTPPFALLGRETETRGPFAAPKDLAAALKTAEQPTGQSNPEP